MFTSNEISAICNDLSGVEEPEVIKKPFRYVRYSPEFKQLLIGEWINGKTKIAVAEEYGVNPWSVTKYCLAYQRGTKRNG